MTPLDRVSSIFWCRAGANTNDTIQALERDISPKMSRHFSAISMNEKLFARIDDLYQRRDSLGLDAETMRVLEKTWKGFVRSGAKLDAEGKKRLATINEELSSLGTSFGQNVLADEQRLGAVPRRGRSCRPAGFPEELRWPKPPRCAARRAAMPSPCRARSTSRSRTFSERRDLREKAFRAFTMRGENGGATDNTVVVRDDAEAARRESQASRLRASFAALKLDDTMAKTPKAVHALLIRSGKRRWRKQRPTQTELQRLAAEAGSNEKFAAWDWRFYQEKLRAEKFAFDEAELKPYLQLDRIIDACFDVATSCSASPSTRSNGMPPGIPMSASSRSRCRRQRASACSSPIISPGPPSAPAPG